MPVTETNAQQIADWNGEQGQRWADQQALLDRMVEPFGNAALQVEISLASMSLTARVCVDGVWTTL